MMDLTFHRATRIEAKSRGPQDGSSCLELKLCFAGPYPFLFVDILFEKEDEAAVARIAQAINQAQEKVDA